MKPTKRIKQKYIISVSLDRESYMLWKRLPNGLRSQLVQKSIKNHFNKGLTPEEAEQRIREKIKLLQDDRIKKIDMIEAEYNSIIAQEVLILETLHKAQSNEALSKLKEVSNNV